MNEPRNVAWLRVATAIAAASCGVLAVAAGTLPACVDHGSDPSVHHDDAAIDTCTANGGTCRSREVIEIDGPCGLTANEAPDLVCPPPPIAITGIACCVPKHACDGTGTCDYEGTCDGDVISALSCANGKSCCVRRTDVDASLDAPDDR